MKSTKLLLFVFGEYYFSLRLCLFRFLLTVRFVFLAVVPCAAGAVFSPFNQEVAANFISVTV